MPHAIQAGTRGGQGNLTIIPTPRPTATSVHHLVRTLPRGGDRHLLPPQQRCLARRVTHALQPLHAGGGTANSHPLPALPAEGIGPLTHHVHHPDDRDAVRRGRRARPQGRRDTRAHLLAAHRPGPANRCLRKRSRFAVEGQAEMSPGGMSATEAGLAETGPSRSPSRSRNQTLAPPASSQRRAIPLPTPKSS